MIYEQQEQNSADRAVSNHGIANILSRSFLTARLLIGNSTQAEKAVMDAISVWNPDEEDEEQLFQITLRTALQEVTLASAASNYDCAADLCLPVELRRVTELPPEMRQCFVLRVLVGLPSYICAQILNRDIHQLDQHCCDAITNLAALDSVQGLLTSPLSRNCSERQILD